MQRLGRNTLLRSIFEQAALYGVHRRDILSEIDLDPQLADQPGAFIPSEKLIDAVEYAAIASGRKDFGLRLGSKQDHRGLGPIGLLVEHCNTVAEAVAEGSRYLHLHNSALVYTLTTHGDQCVFRLQLLARGRYVPSQYVEALFMMFRRFCQLLLSTNWTPLSVTFEHERISPLSDYRKYFGTSDIRFGQPMTAVLARKADFAKPLRGADHRMREMVRRLLDDLDSQPTESLPTKVAALIRPLLHSGTVTASRIAALISLAPRTFQRRLASHNTSFDQILRDTRIELAKDYIHREDITVTKMAEVLGYAHLSGASRFLRENFGQTAKDLKHNARRGRSRLLQSA